MIMPCARWLVPERYPLYGGVPLDRPVFDYKIVNDDLLGLLPPPPNQEFDVLVQLFGMKLHIRNPLKNLNMLNIVIF